VGEDFWRITWQHLTSCSCPLAQAVLPASRSASGLRARDCAPGDFSGVSVLQTIPSLALLAFLIALLNQIGTVPALVALFCTGCFPIVRNTAAGLAEIKPG